nr:growth-regulating factor 4-like [Tanacetum cinerariifolium]
MYIIHEATHILSFIHASTSPESGTFSAKGIKVVVVTRAAATIDAAPPAADVVKARGCLVDLVVAGCGGITVDVDDRNYSSGASSARGLGMESNADSTWRLVPSQLPTASLMESRNDSYLQTKSPQLTMVNAFDPILDAIPVSKSTQQHCLFGNKIDSSAEPKHEQHMMRPFFDEWPEAREQWSSLDVDSKNSFSTTQLSMSTASEYSAGNDCSPNDA